MPQAQKWHLGGHPPPILKPKALLSPALSLGRVVTHSLALTKYLARPKTRAYIARPPRRVVSRHFWLAKNSAFFRTLSVFLLGPGLKLIKFTRLTSFRLP